MKSIIKSLVACLILYVGFADFAVAQPVYGCELNAPISADVSFSNCFVQDKNFTPSPYLINIDVTYQDLRATCGSFVAGGSFLSDDQSFVHASSPPYELFQYGVYHGWPCATGYRWIRQDVTLNGSFWYNTTSNPAWIYYGSANDAAGIMSY